MAHAQEGLSTRVYCGVTTAADDLLDQPDNEARRSLLDEQRHTRKYERRRRLRPRPELASAHSQRWTERRRSSRWLHRVGDAFAHSAAGITAALLAAGWVVVGVATGFPHYWETVLFSVTGATTSVMVFVIQHTQARQIMAMQRKLDEVLRSSSEADNAVIAIEEASDEDLQALGELNFTDREKANEAPSSPPDERSANQRP